MAGKESLGSKRLCAVS